MWLYQGRILCGWHTCLACTELGIEPEYVEVEAGNHAEALVNGELRLRAAVHEHGLG